MCCLLDEVREFLHEPTWDEFSDISFGLGRLIAGFFGKVYITIPFDRRHKEKIGARMKEYGCVRSRRHLINGQCPSIK